MSETALSEAGSSYDISVLGPRTEPNYVTASADVVVPASMSAEIIPAESLTQASEVSSEPVSSDIDSSLPFSSEISSVSSAEETSSEIISSAEESSESSSASKTMYDGEEVDSYYIDNDIDLTLTGEDLKTNLFGIISTHTDIGYSALWNAFKTTDAKANGSVWCMYSDYEFDFTADKDSGSGGTTEGDKYNREHTIPQSVFSEKSPMKADLFHLYPTDKLVNNKRGNYPHAEVATASYTSGNGTKIGTSNTANVTGNVCEPADEYKGDFARTYFYFVTAYQDKMSGFGSFAAFAKNTYPSLAQWAIDLYEKWSEDDPVSQKEIDRNEAVYGIQGNRNPFIDMPGLEKLIW